MNQAHSPMAEQCLQPPGLPPHPEAHSMRWSALEVGAIEAYGRQVREHALAQAAAAVSQHDRTGREWVPGSFWDTLHHEAAARIRAMASRSTHA